MNRAGSEHKTASKQLLTMFAGVFLTAALGMAAFERVLAPEQTVPPAPADLYAAHREKSPLADETVEDNHRVTLIAVGDVMLSRAVARKLKRNGVDYPFEKTREFLNSGDVVFGNLEHPITLGREINDDELKLRANPDVITGLVNAGFDVMSVANNHIPDFGEPGVKDTMKYLDAAGIRYVGAGATLDQALQPAVMEVNGLTFAFLAFNDTDVVPASYGAIEKRAGTALMDVARMTAAVKAAKTLADVVIVSMHAGIEYTQQPNMRQQEFAHAVIDAGAELVIGHHPHVVQPVEQYNGKYILYSLGNFVFDQMWSQQTREGMVVKITFGKSGVTGIEYKPVLIEDYSQPRFLEGAEADAVLARLRTPS